jgi:hypothetical protein
VAEALIALQAMPPDQLQGISDRARTYVRIRFDWSAITAQTIAMVYLHPSVTGGRRP